MVCITALIDRSRPLRTIAQILLTRFGGFVSEHEGNQKGGRPCVLWHRGIGCPSPAKLRAITSAKTFVLEDAAHLSGWRSTGNADRGVILGNSACLYGIYPDNLLRWIKALNPRTVTSAKHMFWRVQPTFWGGVVREDADHGGIWGFFVRIYDIYPDNLPGRMRC